MMDDPTKAGLRDAAIEGWIMLNQYPTNPPSSYFVTNGWVYPPPDNGRAGQSNDFMTRAGGQSLIGIINNDAAEAVYLAVPGGMLAASLSAAPTPTRSPSRPTACRMSTPFGPSPCTELTTTS